MERTKQTWHRHYLLLPNDNPVNAILTKMRVGILIALFIALGSLFVGFYILQPHRSNIIDRRNSLDVSIILTDKGFEPRDVRISKGTRVSFRTDRTEPFWPASDAHPTHSIYPEFDAKKPVSVSSTWSFVFQKVGAWGYHDHLRSYFNGTIYVDE